MKSQLLFAAAIMGMAFLSGLPEALAHPGHQKEATPTTSETSDQGAVAGRGMRGRGGEGGMPQRSARGGAGPLFSALDTDGDGTLSRKELEEATKLLKLFDQDRDNKLSAEEISNQAGSPATMGRGQRGGRGGMGASQGRGGKRGAAAGKPGATNAENVSGRRGPAAGEKSKSPFDK